MMLLDLVAPALRLSQTCGLQPYLADLPHSDMRVT